MSQLPELELRQITLLDETREVYCVGTGPAVIVMHEVPGLHPGVVAFGHRLAAAGFRAYLPSLFGTPFKPVTAGYSLRSMMRACVASEFATWATRKTSPIVRWLRELAKLAHDECGGPGVGAIGMCLTGNFALSLMVDESVMAPVLSQPSLPFPISKRHREGLHVSAEDLETVKKRARSGCGVLGLRFTADPLVPRDRFDRLRRELGPGFEAIEIDSGRGNPHGIARTAHSVVTNDLVDEAGHPTRAALDRVLGFFSERLRHAG
jgi:dienelactone hydrolase